MSMELPISAELALAGAGGVGAVARYLLGQLAIRRAVLLTLLINIAGSVLLGCVLGVIELRGADAVLNLLAAFCGGFTTFSSFALQIQNVWCAHGRGAALALILAHVLGCVGAATLGWQWGSSVFSG